jgi:hypothetical protein
MPTTGVRPEDKLIDLFLTVYDDCSWVGALSEKVSPERTIDGGVEMLATRASDGRRLAIEHTLIEAFVGEKTDFHSHYKELAVRLQADESLQVAGLAITVEAPVNVLPRGSNWRGIIDDVSDWVRAEGRSWPEDKVLRDCRCPHHPDGRLTFQVHTTPLGDSTVKLVNVQRYGELRVWESVEKALRGRGAKTGKPTKLARTEADTRLLILEREQPGVHPKQIWEQVERLRPLLPDLAMVDEIWIADTATFSGEKNYLCFSTRDGQQTPESFTFYAGKLAFIARGGSTVYTAQQGWWFQRDRPHPEARTRVEVLSD